MKVDIQSRSLKFAIRVLKFCNRVPKGNAGSMVVKQLVRSGSSVGANLEEASAASSKKDFINKIAIACKECRETRYWLILIKEAELLHNPDNLKAVVSLINESDELVRILSAIFRNSKIKTH